MCCSEELSCAALTLASQLVVEVLNSGCRVKTDGVTQPAPPIPCRWARVIASDADGLRVSACSQGDGAVACLRRWGELVCSCCGEEQPPEVKLAAAKVLVSCAGSVLRSPELPLGECA